MRCAIFGHKVGEVTLVKVNFYSGMRQFVLGAPAASIEFKGWCRRCGALIRGNEKVSRLAAHALHELTPKPRPEKEDEGDNP